MPVDAAAGRYRFVVTATRYTLTSAPFDVFPSKRLEAVVSRSGSSTVIRLDYPKPVVNADLTTWPATARDGVVTAFVGGVGRRVTLRKGRAVVKSPSATVPEGAARDAFGNLNG